MKKRKIFGAVLSVLLLVSLLTGCSAGKQKNPESSNADNSNAISSEVDSQATQSSNEPAELTYLRAQIRENNALVGVACIEEFLTNKNITTDSLAGDCAPSLLFEKYPFLSNCKVALNNGNVMLAIVPANQASAVTVYKSGIDNDGNTKDEKDKVLFTGEAGAPVILLCNDNEAYSNVLISVKDGDKTVEFRPTISLENGRDLVLSEGCYDFSVFDMRRYADAAHDYDDAVYMLPVTGAQLKRMLTHVLRDEAFEGDHTEFYQFSQGMKIVWSRKEHCFRELSLNGEPINDEKIYRIAMQTFHYMNLKDFLDITLDEVKENGSVKVLATSFRSVVEEYLSVTPNLFREVEGRLIVED